MNNKTKKGFKEVNIKKSKQEIIYFTKLLYKKNYVVASEGNISYRISNDKILITASGVLKDRISEDDIIIIDKNGTPIRSNKIPSSEKFAHLQIYNERLDVNVIIHAHPIFTIIQTMDNEFFKNMWLPEANIFLKNPKILPPAQPSSKETAQVISGNCNDTNILIIQKHGIFTYGKSLEEAFNLLEITEKYCKIDYFLKLKK